jgi:hypothetical protein
MIRMTLKTRESTTPLPGQLVFPFIADFHGRENNQSSYGCRGQW